MVMSDNRAYDYSKSKYYNAYPLPEQQPAKQPKSAPRPKKKERARTHIFSIALVFSISILIISRYAYIAEINFGVLNSQNEYKSLMKENSELNVELMRKVDLETLEKTAVEQYGMQYPDVASQVVYLSVAMPAESNYNKYKEYTKKSDVMENKYIAYAKGTINNLLKFLD